MPDQQLHYHLRMRWTGGDAGTRRYDAYGRDFRVDMPGKPSLLASADPTFLGDARKPNPEDLFLSALSSCHMLFYLALCARNGVDVLAYDDEAHGVLDLHRDGGGVFSEITLAPTVTISIDSDPAKAKALHARAGERCFIARSCRVPIHHVPTIRVADAEAQTRDTTAKPERAMQNIAVALDNVPGALAAFGEQLGQAGIGLEGGGVFTDGVTARANFLVDDGPRAIAVLRTAGFDAIASDVLILRLEQERDGQLGLLARRMAEAGINIAVQYSDHANRLILVVDDLVRGRAVADAWSAARASRA